MSSSKQQVTSSCNDMAKATVAHAYVHSATLFSRTHASFIHSKDDTGYELRASLPALWTHASLPIKDYASQEHDENYVPQASLPALYAYKSVIKHNTALPKPILHQAFVCKTLSSALRPAQRLATSVLKQPSSGFCGYQAGAPPPAPVHAGRRRGSHFPYIFDERCNTNA